MMLPYKRKKLNYRPMVAIAFGVACGIYFASLKIDTRAGIMFASFFAVFLFLGLFAKKSDKKSWFFQFAMISLGILAGFVLGNVQLSFFTSGIINGQGEIVGSVTSVSHGLKENLVILDDIKLNGVPILGKAEMKLDESYSAKVGDIIKGIGNLKGSRAISTDRIYSYYVSENIKYIGSCQHISVIGKYTLNLSEQIRNNVFTALVENLEYQNAGIVMGMTFGDTSMLNQRVTRAFQVSGLGHLFAVSGLHVGFFYMACKRFLRSVNLRIRSIIAFVLVGFYVYTCGMTTSATRAFVMITVMILSENFAFEVDGLTNLSFAMLIVILSNPYSLFSAGFALSFGATLGLIILKPPIARLLPFDEVKNDHIGGLIAIQILTLPLMSYYFSYISTFSFLLNFALIPIISVMYVLNMVIILLQQTIGINLLFLTNATIGLLKNILLAVESTGIAVIEFKFTPLSVIITGVLAFFASDLVMIKSKTKSTVLIILGLCLSASLFIK